jgi:hypothetical protein
VFEASNSRAFSMPLAAITAKFAFALDRTPSIVEISSPQSYRHPG